MMKRFAILAAVVALIGCTQNDEGLDNITTTPEKSQTEFYASMPECDTRTYVEDNRYLRWNADDEITVFAGNSYNSHWQFAGENGANSGKFNEIDEGGFVTGTPLDLTANYAIYPYDENITITEAGVVSLTLPAVQEYNHAYENSFGAGANTMMAVTKNTSDNFLSFKNLCGYLKLKFYGNDVTVKSITVKGNNGEKIAGPATVSMAYGGEPTITMGDDATDTITVDCGEGVSLSNDAANPTTFWVVIPEITFEGGITIEVTDINDQTFSKQTTNAVPIENNLIQPMATLEVEAAPAGPANNEIWYTATGKIDKDWTSIGSGSSYFGATVISHEWDSETGKGVITFDNDVTIIGFNAFMDCISLTSVTIPDSVTTISAYVFAYCSNLTSVTIPDSVTIIGAMAFCKCSSLTSISIPDSVTIIYESAFSGCSSLTSITIPDSITVINSSTFSDCSNLSNIIIPDGVTIIYESAFSGCSSLSSITIPDSVTSIGKDSFSGCSSLSSITIPDSVTSIGEDSFSGCSSLTSVYITDLSAWCKIDFMSIGSHPLSNGSDLYLNNELVSDIIIPNDITEIKSYAFYNCHSLVSITIPDTVTTIGDYAFSGCSNLIKFKGNCASEDGRCVIIDGVLSSFASAELTEYTIPDSVTTIGDHVFYMCSSLTKVTIPDSITSIGRNPFAGCRCELIVNCDVPEKAFRGDFTKITIGDGVTTIGAEGFSGCSSLSSLTIGKGVTTIGTDAFEYCTGDLIVNCSIPSSPYDGAFYGSKFTSVTIGDGVTEIGDYAFNSCSSLTSVTIPDSVTSIGNSAFVYCTSLTSITIPDSVTTIGEFAFAGCKGLTSITIPDSVTMNGRCAFLNCKSLTSVYCKPTTPPDVTLYNNKWSAFDNTAAGRTIYVPNGLVNTYKSANGWKEYADAIVGYDF